MLVPVGSTEQHGPHLPLATDALVATASCREAAVRIRSRGTEVAVAPPVSYGASGEHEGFAGTVSIGHEALYALLIEIGRSACHWAAGVVFVNGHGGNVPTVAKAVDLLRYEGRSVAWTACQTAGDAHAGRTETSLLLHLAPHLVRTDLAERGCVEDIADLLPRLRDGGVQAVSPNGVLGDPTGSSASEGAELFERLVGRLVRELVALEVDGKGRLRLPPERIPHTVRPSRRARPTAGHPSARGSV